MRYLLDREIKDLQAAEAFRPEKLARLPGVSLRDHERWCRMQRLLYAIKDNSLSIVLFASFTRMKN